MKTIKNLIFLCTIAFVHGKIANNNQTKNVTSDEIKEDGEERLAQSATKAAPEEFPFMASIQIKDYHICGGALISATKVLTACHCLHEFMNDKKMKKYVPKMRVEVGSEKLGKGQSFKIQRLACINTFTQGKPDSNFLINDIGVITLRTPVTLSNKVRTISLPTPYSELPENALVTVIGFGNAYKDGPVSDNLQKTELRIISQQECNKYYSSMSTLHVTYSNICTNSGIGYGTCQGDSGSPMIYNGQIVGVVSGGTGRCGQGDPDIFTKVSLFISFIQNELNGDTSVGTDIDGGINAKNIS